MPSPLGLGKGRTDFDLARDTASLESMEPTSPTPHVEYTTHWFEDVAALWRDWLTPFCGKADVHYLEIGVFEGQSLFWMLEQILTGDRARATVIDPLYPGYRARFLRNLSRVPHRKRVTLLEDQSAVALRTLAANTVDIVYVDGSHTAKNVFLDIALSWNLLKVGGILLLDDLEWEKESLPLSLRPEAPIQTFLTAFAGELEVLHQGWRVAVKKCHPYPKRLHSRFGSYYFGWETGELVDSNGALVPTSPEQLQRIRDALIALPLGEANVPPDHEVLISLESRS